MRPTAVRLLALAGLAAASLVGPGRAIAAGPDPEAYQALLEKARSAHAAGEYDACEQRYGEAFAMSQDPTLLYNRAVCLFDGGHDRAALVLLQTILASAPSPASAAEARRLLERIDAQRRMIDAKERERAANDRADRREMHLVSAAVTGGLGVVSLIAAGGVMGLSDRLWRDAQAACPGLVECPDDRGRDLSRQSLKTLDVATALWVVGGLALTTALVTWLTAPDPPPEEPDAEPPVTFGVSPGPAGVTFGLRGTL